MIGAPLQPATLPNAVEMGGYLRRSPARFGAAVQHKEWLHFCIVSPNLHLLLNFSLMDKPASAGRPGFAETARLIALASTGGPWTGGLSQPHATDVRPEGGTIDLDLGGSSVRFEDGRFQIRLDEPKLGIRGSLELTPVTFPSIVHNFPLGDRKMHWFTLPHLRVSGRLDVGGVRHELEDAVAYHDHNWGHFRFGGDYSWQWGFAAPLRRSDEWSVVFLHLADRAGRATEVQGVFVWKGEHERRLFRDRDIRVRAEGIWRPSHVFTVPGVMRLIQPGRAVPVPQELVVEAHSRSDELKLTFRPGQVAQIVLPNDGQDGFTTLHEAAGTIEVAGTIDGERFSFETGTIVEFLGG